MPTFQPSVFLPVLSITDAPPDWFRGKNLIDSEFGRWTVIGWSHKNAYGMGYWWCRCECRTVKIVNSGDFKGGASTSCGCRRSEVIREIMTTHGATVGKQESDEYSSWCSMIERCTNPNSTIYSYYGGRGITICDRWRHDFAAFLADMGKRPSLAHTLDRFPDQNGPYSPENCRWATKAEQAQNKRDNNNIEFRGVTKCLAVWARELGVGCHTLRWRIKTWGLEKAMTTPPRHRHKIKP